MNFVSSYIKKPHLVLSFVILLSVIGIIGYQRMPFNLFPDTDRPQISVVTVMPGAAASDVETDITRIIEKEDFDYRHGPEGHIHLQGRGLGSLGGV